MLSVCQLAAGTAAVGGVLGGIVEFAKELVRELPAASTGVPFDAVLRA